MNPRKPGFEPEQVCNSANSHLDLCIFAHTKEGSFLLVIL